MSTPAHDFQAMIEHLAQLHTQFDDSRYSTTPELPLSSLSLSAIPGTGRGTPSTVKAPRVPRKAHSIQQIVTPASRNVKFPSFPLDRILLLLSSTLQIQCSIRHPLCDHTQNLRFEGIYRMGPKKNRRHLSHPTLLGSYIQSYPLHKKSPLPTGTALSTDPELSTSGLQSAGHR